MSWGWGIGIETLPAHVSSWWPLMSSWYRVLNTYMLLYIFLHFHTPAEPSLDLESWITDWFMITVTYIIHILIVIFKLPADEWIWIRCDNSLLSLVLEMYSRHLRGLFTFRKTISKLNYIQFRYSVVFICCLADSSFLFLCLFYDNLNSFLFFTISL